MKFLCVTCDQQMHFTERREPGDGTFAAAFSCPGCGHRIALLANPMETQLVGSLGVEIGGRTLEQQPLEFVRSNVVGKDDAFEDDGGRKAGGWPTWSNAAESRLARVPGFVRGMVKRIYGEYAHERGIGEITPEVMDRARVDLGLEGM
ncbi:MAG: PCP reductase family protein [Gemmatimonadales bacterium]|jgi:DNA-directed RNA polymerase subunit RPC12/RpoP